MNYVCYKVGLIFPNCTKCETYMECKEETERIHSIKLEAVEVPATA